MASLSHCFLLTYLLQHEHPYISAMIGNGSVHYDHDRDGTLSQVAGCSVSIYLCYLFDSMKVSKSNDFQYLK